MATVDASRNEIEAESADGAAVAHGGGVALPVLVTFACAAAILVLRHLFSGTDYVGLDNDDTMRLIQVRDLLSGQGWFDLTQYRLGLDGGTLMHWSRLIDLPIANLITVFSSFLAPRTAEAAALMVWPLLTMLALLHSAALAGRRLGGDHAVFAALLLTAIFAATGNRFGPGAIDHHNAQMALLVYAAAGLLHARMSRSAFAGAGIATGLAIAIGAEIVPLMAVICGAVAVIWAVRGVPARAAAKGFGLALGTTLTAIFYLTVPPTRYGVVACDAYSAGFYSLGTLGGGVLFLLAARFSGTTPAGRFVALGLAGALVGAAVVAIAPHCLESPLADLDPLLKTMWLAQVSEAQSPEMVATFYLLPVAAIFIALDRARRGIGRQANLVLAALIAVAFAIALIQVRGAVFANLLAILVLAPVIGEARARLHAAPTDRRAALRFCLVTLFGVQAVWAIGGDAFARGIDYLGGPPAVAAADADAEEKTPEQACRAPQQMAVLAAEPAGVVSAVSNIGDDILRHTGHRVLSAPYHRNQGGMLTQLHIAMESPETAQAFLKGAGVTLLVFCPGDPETRTVTHHAPEGLFADLGRSEVPAYLLPIHGQPGDAMLVYKVR